MEVWALVSSVPGPIQSSAQDDLSGRMLSLYPLDRVTVLIEPVLGALNGLLTCLDGNVSGFLLTVNGLLSSLLGGLGLGDLCSAVLSEGCLAVACSNQIFRAAKLT